MYTENSKQYIRPHQINYLFIILISSKIRRGGRVLFLFFIGFHGNYLKNYYENIQKAEVPQKKAKLKVVAAHFI